MANTLTNLHAVIFTDLIAFSGAAPACTYNILAAECYKFHARHLEVSILYLHYSNTSYLIPSVSFTSIVIEILSYY